MDFDEDFEQNAGEEGGEGGPNFDDLFGGDVAAEGGAGGAVSMNDAVIFLVDCRKSLFKKDQDGKTQFDLVIEAISGFMKTKVITSKDDRMALILYNAKKTSNPLSFQGINLVFSLENPDAEGIKRIMNINKEFDRNYGSSDKEVPLFEALWLCTHVFKDIEKKPYTKRIFLFTNEDNPSATDKNQRDQAVNYAKRLGDMDVDIELFPLKKENDTKFEVRRFFADLITIDPDDANQGIIDTSSRITELTKRIRQKIYKKRQLGSIDFHLAPGVKLAVRFYTMIHTATKPTPLNLDSNTNKRLTNAAKMICEDTGAVLHKDQVDLYFPFGDEKVFFKKEDIAEIKKFDDPSLKLMGFKPSSRLKPYHNLRSSYFLYPDEERIQGSSQLCDALIKQMIAKDRIAIVRFVPRVTSSVRFAALLPQSEAFDEDNFQTPPGFNLVFLPFADDIRKLATVKPDSKPDVDRNQVVNAKLLIKSLSAEFDCRNFENPNLQTFYSNLQAIALNEQEPEDIEDLLLPDEEGMKKYENVVQAFKDSIWEGGYNPSAGAAAPKRGKKKADDEDSAPTRRGRAEKVDRTDMDDYEESKGRSRGGRGGARGGARGGRKKRGSDDEDEGPDDYDFNDDFIVDDRPKGNKRGGSKKRNEDEMEEENQFGDVEQWLREGDLKSLKVNDLKEYLKSKGLPTGGKKDDLVDRALNHLSK